MAEESRAGSPAQPVDPSRATHPSGVRVDRWLWAARFFRTRALAKAAIESGKVLILPAPARSQKPGSGSGSMSGSESSSESGSESRSGSGSVYDSESAEHRGVKPKPGREIRPGELLLIRRGDSAQIVLVQAVEERRGSATLASRLYEETAASVEARETARARHQLERAGLQVPAVRPDKRARRERMKLKHGGADSTEPDSESP